MLLFCSQLITSLKLFYLHLFVTAPTFVTCLFLPLQVVIGKRINAPFLNLMLLENSFFFPLHHSLTSSLPGIELVTEHWLPQQLDYNSVHTNYLAKTVPFNVNMNFWWMSWPYANQTRKILWLSFELPSEITNPRHLTGQPFSVKTQ